MRTASIRLGLTGIVTAAAVTLGGIVPSAAAAPTAAAEVPTVNIADTEATAETRSLFSYLDEVRGEGVLFGHQHTTDNGITFEGPADGVESDILAGTGDYPAVFGWDTLILEGLEKPGLPGNTAQQNVAAFADGLKNAHRLGGISTISAHMRNFVTGNDFTDPSGRVVTQILPGAPKNGEFNAYLDLIADTANAAVADDGTLIPIIFRPFHENTGSWFWWGAAHATAGEYKEIFRYTVEYLRDTKGVSNLLFAYSPNGAFGGDPTRYLATYPGGAWVDVLGYDSYENSNEPDDSDAWIATVIPDLAMVSDLADERGKVAAFTEFGRNGDRTIKPSGNKSVNYYTDLLAAIKADPKASRIAYMQTWSNWGLEQFYVPYPAYSDQPAHEMYTDFVEYYDDPFTVFAGDVADDAFTRDTAAAAAQPTVRVATPSDGARVLTPTTTVRVKATVAEPTRVYFTVGDDSTQYDLALAADGYYTGEWQIGEENLDNTTATLTAVAEYDGSPTLQDQASVILGAAPVLPVGVIDDFEGYDDDAALRAAYAFNNASPTDIALTDEGVGENGLRFAYDFAAREYGGFGKVFAEAQDWSAFNRLNTWLLPDGKDQKLVLQLKAGGQTFEAYPSLAGTDPTEVSIHFNDFRPPSWDSANAGKRITQERLKSVTEFFVYINKAGDPTSGAIVLDDIRAIAGEGGPVPPGDGGGPDPTTGLIDDFEGYADDTALRSGWSRAGAATLSLSSENKASGAFGAAFPYTSAFTEFQKAISGSWEGQDRLAMWVKPTGNAKKIVLQLNLNGNSYDAETAVSGTEPVEVSIPFTDFVPSPWQGRDPALRPTAAELAAPQSLAIFIEQAPASTPDSGVLYFDDIRATVAPVAPVDQALVDDFESYADDAAQRSAWAGRDNEDDLSLTAEAGQGSKAAAFAYDFSSVTYAGIAKSVDLDWSEYDQVGMWVEPDGSGHQVVVQFKAGGIVYEGYATLTGTDAARVEVPFADAVPATYQGLDPNRRPSAAELADIQEVAIFVTKLGAGTTGTVVFDDVRASVGEPDPDPVPAASVTKVTISDQILFSWQRAKVTVAVKSDGDEVPTGEVTLRVGGKTYTAELNDKGKAKFTVPKLRQGIYSVKATYAGDAYTEPSSSPRKLILVLF